MIKEHAKKVNENKIDLDGHFSKVLEQCHSLDKKFDCFITIDDEYTKNQINTLKQKIGKVKNLALAGVAVSVKDCLCTKGLKSTAGSRILENYIPPFESTATRKIIEAGGIIVGKTCMDEFGFGSWSSNCAFKVPKNPLDTERTCGGSSGGAACVTKAADFPHIAIAESTGGSISCPACFCQVYGLTPTYGLVSRYGLIDYANSLDKIGLISKDMEGIAVGLKVIAGYDEKDKLHWM